MKRQYRRAVLSIKLLQWTEGLWRVLDGLQWPKTALSFHDLDPARTRTRVRMRVRARTGYASQYNREKSRIPSLFGVFEGSNRPNDSKTCRWWIIPLWIPRSITVLKQKILFLRLDIIATLKRRFYLTWRHTNCYHHHHNQEYTCQLPTRAFFKYWNGMLNEWLEWRLLLPAVKSHYFHVWNCGPSFYSISKPVHRKKNTKNIYTVLMAWASCQRVSS